MALKLAILGFGDEGQAAYRYFSRRGADITVFDEAEQPKYQVPEGVKLVCGPGSFNKVMGFDKVLRGSPAIRPDKFQTDGERTSLMQEFFAACASKNIIGITGTKGKGTIASLTYAILKQAGLHVHLAGNIGVPALDIVEDITADDVVVLELSSFQLWDMARSPHIAVVGMIEPEHLEVHKDFAEYVAAKANIAKWQTPDDMVIYHPTNEYSAQIAAGSPGAKIRYNTPEGAYIDGQDLIIADQVICSTRDVRIPGPHNLDNICAALTAAWQYTNDAAAAAQAITSFTGLPHRLEYVREVRGAKFYNDSISTTPGSLAAAMRSFDPAHEIFIVGGSYDKGADFRGLIGDITTLQPKKILFVGPMGKRIFGQTQNAGYTKGELHESWNMVDVTRRADELTAEGDVVILSPAFASFGDFANYKARGEQFKMAVSAL
jgi:UDP-N-acetylmuramoylalanine--D-glutamate ligase